MSEKDNNVMPLATDPHNLGEFDNVYDAMRRYPNGGVDGDYIYILGVQHFWNVNRQSWGILKDKEDNLVQMVEDFIGLFERRGYVFAGYALPDTTPVSGLDNIFYIAAKNGVYTHFGSDLKLLNEVAILRKPRRSSIWIKDSMDIPNSERIDVIDDAISRINVDIKTIKSAIIGMENDLDGVHDSIDDINKDIDAFKKETSENFEEVNSDLDKVEKRLDYIPKESFLSARPAGFKPDIDLTPEITVDRAWRDHEGNVIRDTYITRRGLRNEIIDITNQQVTDLKPGSVDPDDLSEATKQLIGNKSITNLPDEEDITVLENQTLKLKDKEYAPKDYSGMGRVYLRKHYVNGVNTLTRHMMRKPNTIYIIQYDYCLAGQTIEVPENCVLDFQGGSLRNGTLKGDYTCIKSALQKIFDLDITLNGKWSIDYIYPEWFGALGYMRNDSTAFIQKSVYISVSILVPVKLSSRKYYITSSIYLPSYSNIEGSMPGGYDTNIEPTIIANFGEESNDNTFAWIFDTDSINKSTGERLKYNSIEVSYAVDNNRYYNACRNIRIKGIRIEAENKIFGGIRLFGSPGSKIEEMYICNTKIAVGIFVSWDVVVRDVISLSYVCGAFVNECQAVEFDNTYMNGRKITDPNGKYILEYTVTEKDYFEDFNYFKIHSDTHNLETFYDNYKRGSGIIAVDCRNLLLNHCLYEHWSTGINLNVVYQAALNNYYIEDIWYIGVRIHQSTVSVNGAYQVGDSRISPQGIIYLFDIGIGGNCTVMGYRYISPLTWNTNIYTPSKDHHLFYARGFLIIMGNGYRNYPNFIKGNPGVTIYDDINSMFVDMENPGFLQSKDYVNIPQKYDNGTNGIFYYRVCSCGKGQRVSSFVFGSLRNGENFMGSVSIYNPREGDPQTGYTVTTSYITPEEVTYMPTAYYDNNIDDPNTIDIYIRIDSGCNLYFIGNAAKSQKQTIDTTHELRMRYIRADDLYDKIGNTSQRPEKVLGREYFDTTLNKPIWWNGTNWIDATGATV